MIIIIIGNETYKFEGDELTSPEHDAIKFLQRLEDDIASEQYERDANLDHVTEQIPNV